MWHENTSIWEQDHSDHMVYAWMGVLTGLSLGPEDRIMSTRELPKVADAEKESLYVYVFGVSGPGK